MPRTRTTEKAFLDKLRKECMEKGLDTRGREDELLHRLEINQVGESETDYENTLEEETEMVPQLVLDKDYPMGSIPVELALSHEINTNKDFTLASLPALIPLLEKEVASIETQTVVDQSNIASLEEHMNDFKTAVADYKLQRNCFISTFKHSKLNRGTQLDHKIIERGAGNSEAEKGDVIADAQLYIGVDGRRDYYEFRQLYGFLPKTVLKLSK